MASGASTVSMTVEIDPDRQKWGNKVEFILSVVSYAVGLGNIWRFSYLCEKDGGGAFLIPYLIMALLEGLPIFYLEFLIGQSVRKGAVGVWRKLNPRITGIGYASAVVSFIVGIYYNVLITWCLWYFARSFWINLPWETCDQVSCSGTGYKKGDGTVHFLPEANYDDEVVSGCEDPPKFENGYKNITGILNSTNSRYFWDDNVLECKKSSRTQYFFYRTTLDITDNIQTLGGFNIKMFITMTFAWIVVFLCLAKGIKSTGKVVYFTALFPYIVMLIFFFRAIFLSGFYHGLIYLFSPKFEQLLQPRVWLDAAGQIFFSFGLAFGGLIAFASYNPPDYNCKRDVIAVTFCNCGTGLFAASIIFSILGNKAYEVFSPCVNKQFTHEFNYLIQNKSYLNEKAQWLGVDPNNDKSAYVFRYTDFFGEILKEMKNPNSTIMNHTYSYDVNDTSRSFTAWLGNSSIKGHFCDLDSDLKKAGGGTGLAFIAFTEAILKFPFPPIWSILFFLMLLALGLGSEFGTLVGVLACVEDIVESRPHWKNRWFAKKWAISGMLCFICYLIGMIFVFGNGYYFVDVFDTFGATFPLLLIALFECAAAFFYTGAWLPNATPKQIFLSGYDQICYWNKQIYHKGLERIWTITMICAPIVLIIAFAATTIELIIKPFSYQVYNLAQANLVKEPYPWWVVVLALCLTGSSMIFIPLCFFYYSSYTNHQGKHYEEVPLYGRLDRLDIEELAEKHVEVSSHRLIMSDANLAGFDPDYNATKAKLLGGNGHNGNGHNKLDEGSNDLPVQFSLGAENGNGNGNGNVDRVAGSSNSVVRFANTTKGEDQDDNVFTELGEKRPLETSPLASKSN